MKQSSLRTLVVAQVVTVLTGSALALQVGHASAKAETPRPSAAPVAIVVKPTPEPLTKVVVAKPVVRKKAVVKPTVRRAVARRTATAPSTATTRPAVRTATVRRTAVASPSLTPQQKMMQAVSRIPGYPAGGARWVIADQGSHWGTADWYRGVIYISPSVPDNRMYDVVAHEWSHLLSVKVYNGDVPTATAAMNRVFGGSDLVGAERAADCMARLLGAGWTHYTSCTDPTWRQAAAQLVAGHQI